MNKLNNKLLERWSPWVLLLMVVVLWQVVCAAFEVSEFIFPSHWLIFRDFIKQVLYDTPQVIAGALIIGGLVFLAIERLPRRPRPTAELGRITPLQALAVGVAQIFALIPGVSRSGSSIVGGLLAGLDRPTATAFSFYLSIPLLGAATVVDLLGSLDQIQPAKVRHDSAQERGHLFVLRYIMGIGSST